MKVRNEFQIYGENFRNILLKTIRDINYKYYRIFQVIISKIKDLKNDLLKEVNDKRKNNHYILKNNDISNIFYIKKYSFKINKINNIFLVLIIF